MPTLHNLSSLYVYAWIMQHMKYTLNPTREKKKKNLMNNRKIRYTPHVYFWSCVWSNSETKLNASVIEPIFIFCLVFAEVSFEILNRAWTMAAEQNDFVQILNSLLSSDNAIRQVAEVSVPKITNKKKTNFLP